MLILAIMFFASFRNKQAMAQKNQFVINGKVIRADESSPLEGATIVLKGTKSATGTMPDGAFSLSAATDDTLVVSLDGYETKEIKVTNETYYEIALKHSNSLTTAKKEIDLYKGALVVFGNHYAAF
jgi:hypothetical protein